MKRFIISTLAWMSLFTTCMADTVYSKEMEAKAMRGDAFAQAQLGYCYSTGSGVEKDFNMALEWHHKSASSGNAYSMYAMGEHYLNGEGTDKDNYTAADWFEKSLINGFDKAKEYLDKFALPEAQFDYRLIQLADGGDVVAQFALASWLWSAVPKPSISKESYQINDDKRAFLLMKRAAESGDVAAIFDLGIMYMKGSGTEENQTVAIDCLQKAAGLGYKRAQYLLGDCYAKGIGVEVSFSDALNWINKSAANGYGEALNYLGVIHYYGRLGLQQDTRKAIEMFQKGAKAQSSDAMAMLGHCYLQGIGVEKNFWKAFMYTSEAARLGNPTGIKNAEYFTQEIGYNYSHYINKLKKGAKKGDALAQAILGSLYLTGSLRRNHVDINLDEIQEGVKWTLASAKGGFEEMFSLAGIIYESGGLSPETLNLFGINNRASSRGLGVIPVDRDLARYFYERCASSDASNNWYGMYRLGKAYYYGEKLVGKMDGYKSVQYLSAMIEILERYDLAYQELAEAYKLLSYCYYNGLGVEEDPTRADAYTRKSMRIGNAKAYQVDLLNTWN